MGEQAGLLQVYTPDKLNKLMADSDYVVMALPYTQSTHHLVNAEAVQSMRPNGVLINVGRGKTLEQDAIVKGMPAGGSYVWHISADKPTSKELSTCLLC